MKIILAALAQALIWIPICAGAAHIVEKPVPVLRYEVVRQVPHDTQDFTQGLALFHGFLLESTGQYGHSALIKKDLLSGKTLQRVALDPRYFGEGVTALEGRLYQLSWRNRTVFIYDTALRLQQQVFYPGEGWGLTADANRLILSDGGSHLRFLDPASLRETGRVQVLDQGAPLSQLNELEYARHRVWANRWHSDRILVINPDNGRVEAALDLEGLKQRFEKPLGWDEQEHVLNGIAYDPRSDHFWVTGKCWPALFEIAVEPLK